jgi:hypothetical protein
MMRSVTVTPPVASNCAPSWFRYDARDPGWQGPEREGLVVGYAAPSDSAWVGALEALCRVLP